jgi:hypothetical protein
MRLLRVSKATCAQNHNLTVALLRSSALSFCRVAAATPEVPVTLIKAPSEHIGIDRMQLLIGVQFRTFCPLLGSHA